MKASFHAEEGAYLTEEKLDRLELPKIYREKLQYDLEQIRKSHLNGLRAIVLFGSCARKRPHVGSDIDLLLITEKQVARGLRGELAGDLAEEHNGVATDLVFYTEEEFEKSDCFFVKEIVKDGIILWENHGTCGGGE